MPSHLHILKVLEADLVLPILAVPGDHARPEWKPERRFCDVPLRLSVVLGAT